VKHPIFLSKVNKIIFSIFEKHSNIEFEISNLKIPPVETGFFHAGGQRQREKERERGITNLIVTFRNSTNSPNNQSVNTVQGNDRCWFCGPNKTHKYTVWAEGMICER
jgi:hypothetical protein